MIHWRTQTAPASAWAKVAALAAGLLAAGCSTPGPTLPGASPPAATAQPAPAPAARPPQRRARPAPPTPQPRPSDAKPADKPADSAPAQTAALPPADTAEPTRKPGPAPVVPGLTQIELVRLFGPPRETRDAAPAKVLAFRDDTCALTVYLYYDTGRADFVALQYEVDGNPARGPAADACLIHLRRDDPN